MSVRARQKEATREAIVEAARRLFADRGLLEVSTAEIARAAGVSHGTLFLHFPRREDLQREVIALVGAKITRAVHEAAHSGHTAGNILRSHLRAIAGDEDFYRRLVIEAPLLDPSARATLIGIQSAVAHHFFELSSFQTVQESTQSLIFNTWVGLVHHYVVNKDLFAPDSSVVEKWGEILISHFMGLLGPQGGQE